MTSTRYFALLGTTGLSLLTLAAIGAQALWHWQHDRVVWVMLAGGAVYGVAAWLISQQESRLTTTHRRRALLIIVGTAVLARALLLTPPPVSTDIYRYVWDGRVQAAGINPYRYRPADPQVAHLRDRAVYPHINRADTAPTIYPPLAQLIFLAVTRVTDSVTGMKAAMVGFEAATLAALLALLRRRGLSETRIVFYAWHPLPLFEFAGSGHIDAAAIGLMMLACLAAEMRRPLGAGALLGAAALVKFFPAVIAPALYRRWGWRFPAALLAVVVALYLPYVGVGRQVVGFLPGYFEDEGLTSGSGFFVLRALAAAGPLPPWSVLVYAAVAVAVMGSLAWALTMRRRGHTVSMGGALTLLGAFTILMSPHLAWYFTWVIPFICLRPSWALIYLSAAAPLLYDIVWSPGALPLQTALYVPCALIFALETWRRSRHPPLELSDDRSLGTRHAG